ncbi:hypothetical protein VPH35_104588 [Triticum aestivum]
MDDLERRLQLAVVIYVGGARPLVSCEDTAVAIAAQLGIPRFQFSVHKFHPEDFLVVFTAHQFRNLALAVPSIEHQGIKLFIKPWLRQAQATSRLMRVQVDVMIEGAAEILGSACLIESLAPETASREDLSLFKLRAWCVDPDEVPDPAARAPAFRQLLEYPALVHIGRVRDFSPPELWRGRSDSDDGSGQSGLPDSSHGSQFGGDWVVQPWSCGVRDTRGSGHEQLGPANGGGGGTTGRSYRVVLEGRVGPSNWRLPHMGAGQRSGLVGQGANFATMTEEIPRHSNLARNQVGALATRKETAGELAALDPLKKGGEGIEVPDKSAFAADQVRPADQQQGTLVLGAGVAGQEEATNQKTLDREVQHVDTASVEDDLVVPTRTDHGVGPGDVPPASLDPVRPDSQRDPPSLAVAQEMEPQIIPAHHIVVVGHDQSNGWAPVADLLHGSAGGQPISEVEVAPTSIPGSMQPDVERDGTVGDVTTYAACDDLALISSEPGARNIGLELDATETRLSYKEELAVNNIKTFCAGLLKKLAPPLLKEYEGLRESLGVGGLRKSKASVAETMLLKTLGFDCEDLVVSEDALGQLRQVFDSPL